jgi:hypothetical protein
MARAPYCPFRTGSTRATRLEQRLAIVRVPTAGARRTATFAAVPTMAAQSANDQVPHFDHLPPVLLSSREGDTGFLFLIISRSQSIFECETRALRSRCEQDGHDCRDRNRVESKPYRCGTSALGKTGVTAVASAQTPKMSNKIDATLALRREPLTTSSRRIPAAAPLSDVLRLRGTRLWRCRRESDLGAKRPSDVRWTFAVRVYDSALVNTQRP